MALPRFVAIVVCFCVGILFAAAAANAPNGDFNFDGSVDMSDYVIWREGLGVRYTQADYDHWRANFGSVGSPPGAGSAPVPEPSSLLFAAIFLLHLGFITSGRMSRKNAT